MTRRDAMLAAVAAFPALGGAALFIALRPARADTPAAVNVSAAGLAIEGYDPVAYFAAGRPTPGDPRFTAVHEGATYRFASEDHRRRFLAEPARYVPVYGGFCAYGVSQGYKVKIDPTVFRIVDGRLYLNYDPSIGRRWARDIPGYIRSANANCPGLSARPRD